MEKNNIVFKVVEEDKVELYSSWVDYKLDLQEELLGIFNMIDFKSLLLRQFNTLNKESLKDVAAIKVVIFNVENSLMIYNLTDYKNKHRNIFIKWYNNVIREIALVYKGLNDFIGIDSTNLEITDQDYCDDLCDYRIGVNRNNTLIIPCIDNFTPKVKDYSKDGSELIVKYYSKDASELIGI